MITYGMKKEEREIERERGKGRKREAFEANCKGSGGNVGRTRENLNFKRVRRL